MCNFVSLNSSDMRTPVLTIASGAFGMNSSSAYIIGAIIALFILGYLFYSLIRPEKF
jgi:K+-transporting ATPase KdpF subunit